MEDNDEKKSTDPKILKEFTLIEAQLEAALKLREEERKEWDMVKCGMIKKGYTNKEIREVKSKYITTPLSVKINKLRSRKFYYTSGGSYHRAYYKEKRGEILEKYYQKKYAKKNNNCD